MVRLRGGAIRLEDSASEILVGTKSVIKRVHVVTSSTHALNLSMTADVTITALGGDVPRSGRRSHQGPLTRLTPL
ncbi:hypothetical protein EDF27_0502 [Curtobacterium sp. PhB136]|nr:hypothetical protein EDF27_0502 [Curtobacterium sp. PhB136]